jgi:hypothetical protein
MDFYSKFGDIAIPVTAVILVILVYTQQRLGCGGANEKDQVDVVLQTKAVV